ncbi:hypothetical protein IMSAGC002_04407 [Lachnospiraceae bacterium]|nr:hypothetical protein IMSAGC002_04407 [Lachnospiraceae bacterium]
MVSSDIASFSPVKGIAECGMERIVRQVSFGGGAKALYHSRLSGTWGESV